jgi:hypothetical protein
VELKPLEPAREIEQVAIDLPAANRAISRHDE